MTKEQILNCISVLKEVEKEFLVNTSINTIDDSARYIFLT